MRIESFRVVNYKSFADSGEIHLEPGFNVIVGRNNVGKTALAEAMSLRFSDKPHRSTKTVHRFGAAPTNTASQVEVSIQLKADELADLLVDEFPSFYLPTNPSGMGPGEAWLERALAEGASIEATFRNQYALSPRMSGYPVPTPSPAYLHLTMESSSRLARLGVVHGSPGADPPELAAGLARVFFQRLYHFGE